MDSPAIADLFEDEAPTICDAIWDILPYEGSVVHAMYSGEEVPTFLDLDEPLELEPENVAYHFGPGDMGYYRMDWDEPEYTRVYEEYEEIAFVYGRNATLRKDADRTVGIGLFGTITENLDVFASSCQRLHTEGEKAIRIEKR